MQFVSYYNLVGRKGGVIAKRTSKDAKQQTAIIVSLKTVL